MRSSWEMSAVACFSRAKALFNISNVAVSRPMIGCNSPGIRRRSTCKRKSFSETRLTASDRRRSGDNPSRTRPKQPTTARRKATPPVSSRRLRSLAKDEIGFDAEGDQSVVATRFEERDGQVAVVRGGGALHEKRRGRL